MDFISIAKSQFIQNHLKNNPNANEKRLRENLQQALDDFNSGTRCKCGEDIWVIGSAFSHNACYTCITGEADSSKDYEIEEALPKLPTNSIDYMVRIGKPFGGFFNDEGIQLNPDLHPIPSLCLTCNKYRDPNHEVFCNINRLAQVEEEEFKCDAFEGGREI